MSILFIYFIQYSCTRYSYDILIYSYSKCTLRTRNFHCNLHEYSTHPWLYSCVSHTRTSPPTRRDETRRGTTATRLQILTFCYLCCGSRKKKGKKRKKKSKKKERKERKKKMMFSMINMSNLHTLFYYLPNANTFLLLSHSFGL